MKNLVLAVLVILAFASCDNAKKYKTEIAEIDSTQLQLDSLETLINSIDIDSLVYMQKEASANEAVIRQYYLPDTVDMTFAGKLDRNKRVRKSLSSVESQKVNILKELVEIRMQYTNLKKDVLAGLYDKKQVENYLNVERLDFDQLYINIKSYNDLQIEQKKNFYYANPQIKEYCEILLKNIEK